MIKLECRQFWACLRTLFLLPPTFEGSEEGERLSTEFGPQIHEWYEGFSGDVHGSRRGYPLVPVRDKPDLEDRLLELASAWGLSDRFERRPCPPALCLTHDVDNLRPTWRLRLKRLVSQRRLAPKTGDKDYLASLAAMLAFDAQVSGRRGGSTVFVACKAAARSLARRAAQWLLDPPYSPADADFERLIRLLKESESEVGLHGSFFSLEEGLLGLEREKLQERLGKQVSVGRQHWLNLPSERPLEAVHSAGIRIDSSLGWNGAVGFRCGMARPFPLLVNERDILWEVPLVLMDGPMFDDLGLDTGQVIETARRLLQHVYDRKGCVAVNWHDRAASPDYNWFNAYKRVLLWANDLGFQFARISEAVQGASGEHPALSRDGCQTKPRPANATL